MKALAGNKTVLNSDSKRRAASPASVTDQGEKIVRRSVNQSRSDAFVKDVGLSFGGVYAFCTGPVPTATKGVQKLWGKGRPTEAGHDKSAAPM
jgi:hypothetical protein